MPTISFIITTYNIAPYIERCLASVAQIARPGDEVIIVDDGSGDGTDGIVRDFAATSGFGPGVEYRPVFLGTNTFGGVGIGGNIGLSEATRDTVFFVDGDDWVDVGGFNRARAYWTLNPTDILFTNYREYDQANDTLKSPADAGLWRALDTAVSFDALQKTALAFIAVPWRKFYDRAFLERNKLRFPEGDFFFEDNPFHWEVCLTAASIGFHDQVICYHRVNRPGQTMASTGVELGAFFTHFDTIMSKIPAAHRDAEPIVARWLLNNMTWHMPRLAPQAFFSYASAGARALQKISDAVWFEDLAVTESRKMIWPVATRLRYGDIWGQIDAWDRSFLRKKIEGVAAGVKGVAQLERDIARDTREARRILVGDRAVEQFEALIASRNKDSI